MSGLCLQWCKPLALSLAFVEEIIPARTIAVVLFASACWAQPQPVEFEVASIKPSRPGATGSNFNRRPGGGIEAINVSLKELILFAYDLREQQLAGGPAWLDNDRYNVVAKPKENDNPTGAKRSFVEEFRQVRLKMRSLLADAFSLACTMKRNNCRSMRWWWPKAGRT
jgi:Protein of unknown function (DUF3738)